MLKARLFLFSSIRSYFIWSGFRKDFSPSESVVYVFFVTITEVLPSSICLKSKSVSSKESESAKKLLLICDIWSGFVEFGCYLRQVLPLNLQLAPNLHTVDLVNDELLSIV